MAGGQERILRRRIRSVQSTKKITRAMELIAASRIVKAQQRVEAARPYAEQITEVIRNLAAAGAGSGHPLLVDPERVDRVAYVVVSADRGLCGAYNSNVIRATERAMAADRDAGRDVRLVVVGRKAQSYFRFRGEPIDEAFLGVTDQPRYEQAREIGRHLERLFAQPTADGGVDAVEVVYTQFVSAGTQRVTQRRLMPLEPIAEPLAGAPRGPSADYEFEPAPEVILDRLLPRYVEARLFAFLLDSSASEHAARQRAMKSATDNAEELIRHLTRIMNRARQDAITTEIMEIVGGAEALRQAASGHEDLLVDFLVNPDFIPDSLN